MLYVIAVRSRITESRTVSPIAITASLGWPVQFRLSVEITMTEESNAGVDDEQRRCMCMFYVITLRVCRAVAVGGHRQVDAEMGIPTR